MASRFGTWWQKIRQPLVIVVAAIVLVAVIVLIVVGYRFDWTGFARKTLWDWLQLLIIPIVLAVGGFLLSQVQKSTEYKITRDNQREDALQTYIDKISELLLKEHLGELSKDGKLEQEYEQVRDIARVRTLTVLQRLDAERKTSVLMFLQQSRLIHKHEYLVDLQHANLSGAELNGVDLSQAHLRKAFLSRAKLRNASLCGVILSEATLRKADLSGADLTDATLSDAIATLEQFTEAKNVTPEQLAQIKLSKPATTQGATTAQPSTTPAPSEIKPDQMGQEAAGHQEQMPPKQDTDASH